MSYMKGLCNIGSAIVYNNGFALSNSKFTISDAMIKGAFLYFLEAANAPLHWYWHKSGLSDNVTIPYSSE